MTSAAAETATKTNAARRIESNKERRGSQNAHARQRGKKFASVLQLYSHGIFSGEIDIYGNVFVQLAADDVPDHGGAIAVV
jgi:hypothetical protein